jgi:hypothetical protein
VRCLLRRYLPACVLARLISLVGRCRLNRSCMCTQTHWRMFERVAFVDITTFGVAVELTSSHSCVGRLCRYCAHYGTCPGHTLHDATRTRK